MNIKEVVKGYEKRKKEIKKRLDEFSSVKGDDVFYELCFCLLTPQSNAYKCDEAIYVLRDKDFLNKPITLKPILKKKTRFYRNKSNYLIFNKNQYEKIKRIIINKNKRNIINNKKVRELLVKNVKGMGYKEASHFLRNIGYRNLAILDRHILKNLIKLNVINELPKTLTPKKYLEIEGKFYEFSEKIKVPMDELDLLFWSMETGKMFK